MNNNNNNEAFFDRTYSAQNVPWRRNGKYTRVSERVYIERSSRFKYKQRLGEVGVEKTHRKPSETSATE